MRRSKFFAQFALAIVIVGGIAFIVLLALLGALLRWFGLSPDAVNTITSWLFVGGFIAVIVWLVVRQFKK